MRSMRPKNSNLGFSHATPLVSASAHTRSTPVFRYGTVNPTGIGKIFPQSVEVGDVRGCIERRGGRLPEKISVNREEYKAIRW